jgi:hypothetical protein
MVAGHLQEKNNFYYIVLSYKDETGKRRTKWESTGLPVKKNKKKAEALLQERRRNFIPPVTVAEIRLDEDILFADFMLKWLEVTKSTIQLTTYASYQGMVEHIIVPYFRKHSIKLVELKATDLQDFYAKQLERVKPNTVIHYHANIHKALKAHTDTLILFQLEIPLPFKGFAFLRKAHLGFLLPFSGQILIIGPNLPHSGLFVLDNRHLSHLLIRR